MYRRIMMRDDDHHQKTVNCSWFVGVEKGAVLAEVITCFGDPRIMDFRRCLQVMRKLLYLLNQGETFTKSEAAAVLFSAAKLFRFEDIHLRKLVYLIAEELCPIAEEVDMLKSALLVDLYTFDINLRDATLRPRPFVFNRLYLYSFDTTLRAKAVRLLCRITYVSSIEVEKCLKVAIKSTSFEVSSAGLVCALHLLKKDPGIVIKVFEQVETVAAEGYGLPKFHALCLLARMQRIETTLGIRELARPLMEKILSYELKYGIKNKHHPLFACLMIRLITQIIRASGESGELFEDYWNYMNEYPGNWRRQGRAMAAIEGLYSMMQLRNISGSTVKAAIEEVRSRLPSHETVFTTSPDISHHQKPAFLNVPRSMLKWSRIQNHLQADDDDSQLAKYITQGPTPSINNPLLRKRNMALLY